MSASRVIHRTILSICLVVWATAAVAAPGVLSPKGSGAAVLPNVLLVVAPASTTSPIKVDGFYVPQGRSSGAHLIRGTVFRVLVSPSPVVFTQPLDIRIGCPVRDPTAKAMSQSAAGLCLMQQTSTGWKKVNRCTSYDASTRIASATVSNVYTGTIYGLGQSVVATPAAARPHLNAFVTAAANNHRVSRKLGRWVRQVVWKPSVRWVYVSTLGKSRHWVGERRYRKVTPKTPPALAIPPATASPGS